MQHLVRDINQLVTGTSVGFRTDLHLGFVHVLRMNYCVLWLKMPLV